MTTDIYLRTTKGVIHRATMDGQGSIYVREADNLDQSHDEEVLLELPSDAAPEAYCRRCFPRLDEPEDAA